MDTEESKTKKKIVWEAEFIEKLDKWLGGHGHTFFQFLIDKYGHLNVVLPGAGIPHPVHMREGMSVRNKMRDIHTEMCIEHKDSHWYDNHWQAAVKECLGIPTTCYDCDDSGKSYKIAHGRIMELPCPKCKG